MLQSQKKEKEMTEDTVAIREAAVSELVGASPGQPVLMHWYDIDEHREASQFGGGIKNKFPIEVQCFAIGFVTGEPVKIRAWGNHHFQHVLPNRGLSRAQLASGELAWEEIDDYGPNLGGVYYSLDIAEPTGYEPFGGSKIRASRAAQVIVGEDAIRTWLTQHAMFGKYAELWFAQIVRQLSHINDR
ncbi:MAG: hypothetical protein RIQ56_366 [Candidatus Parcubacteria bacterium]